MPVRSDLFLDVCRNVRHGDLVKELSEELAAAVQAAEASHKVGSITLTLKVKPNGRGQMVIADNYDSKKPRPDAPVSLMFNDVHGNLSRRDPNQGDLALKRVEDDEKEERHHG